MSEEQEYEQAEREAIQSEAKEPVKDKPKHRATYARDNRNGGYLIRVAGPYPEKFAGRQVPVTTRSGKEHLETLSRLIWTGNDKETSDRVALYAFVAKPRADETEELAF